MSATCDRVISSRGPCNTALDMVVLPSGRVVARCPRCTAREAGRCWNCGRPRTNHRTSGVFCAPCGKAANRLSMKRAAQSPEARARDAARFKRKWETDPAFRQAKMAYKKAWKAKRAAAESPTDGPASRRAA